MTIEQLLDRRDVVALASRQPLEPVEGREVPLFPPTYPAPQGGSHRFDTPYTVNRLADGRLCACLDSVQSQANRMEAIFHAPEFEWAVPQIEVVAGDHRARLTELSHRLADAAIRCTELHAEIAQAFEAFAAGRPAELAKLSPTSLVYGAWDSRDTQVKIPRVVRSEILAYDVDVFTRSAQFSGTFTREDLKLDDTEWKKGAEVGFAATPSVNQHGGVLVRGPILQSASVHLGAIRALRDDTGDQVLARYVLGLTLVGLLHGGKDYMLRTGCWLVPSSNERASTKVIRRDGSRASVDFTPEATTDFLRAAAEAARERLGIPLGAPLRSATYDPTHATRLLKAKKGGEA